MLNTIDSAIGEIVRALESFRSAIADPAEDANHLEAGHHKIGDGIEDVCRRLKAIAEPAAVIVRTDLEDSSLYLPMVGTVDRERNRGILLDKLDRAIKVLSRN